MTFAIFNLIHIIEIICLISAHSYIDGQIIKFLVSDSQSDNGISSAHSYLEKFGKIKWKCSFISSGMIKKDMGDRVLQIPYFPVFKQVYT